MLLEIIFTITHIIMVTASVYIFIKTYIQTTNKNTCKSVTFTTGVKIW